jgi:hypothetical protein
MWDVFPAIDDDRMVAFLLDSDEIRSVLCATTLVFLLDSDDLSLFSC